MFEKDRRAATTELRINRERLADYDTERQAWVPRTEHTRALYDKHDQGFGEPANCVVCLRAYDATKAHSGGSERIYCSEPCRKRADDTRRRALPTDWRDCAECGTPFLCLTLGGKGRRNADGSWTESNGKVLCPPAWPAEYWDRSPCYGAHRRRLARVSMRRHRQRKPDNEGLLALTVYRDAELRPFYTPEKIAADRGLSVEAVQGMIGQVEEWLEHARACEQRRACEHMAHRHIRTVNRLLDDLHREAPQRVQQPRAA